MDSYAPTWKGIWDKYTRILSRETSISRFIFVSVLSVIFGLFTIFGSIALALLTTIVIWTYTNSTFISTLALLISAKALYILPLYSGYTALKSITSYDSENDTRGNFLAAHVMSIYVFTIIMAQFIPLYLLSSNLLDPAKILAMIIALVFSTAVSLLTFIIFLEGGVNRERTVEEIIEDKQKLYKTSKWIEDKIKNSIEKIPTVDIDYSFVETEMFDVKNGEIQVDAPTPSKDLRKQGSNKTRSEKPPETKDEPTKEYNNK